MAPPLLYVDPPDIPEGMTLIDYRRLQAAEARGRRRARRRPLRRGARRRRAG